VAIPVLLAVFLIGLGFEWGGWAGEALFIFALGLLLLAGLVAVLGADRRRSRYVDVQTVASPKPADQAPNDRGPSPWLGTE
jgi:hypothetical protein